MPQINSPTPDATTTSKGKVQLAGDLTGTAAVPLIGNAKVTPSKLATGAASATVATNQNTASTTYADLTTTTDTVTVTIGDNGLAFVTISALIYSSGTLADNYVAFAVSGANTIAATDAQSISNKSTNGISIGASFLLTGLTAGSTTFKMKYRVSIGGATGNYVNRNISVIPL